MSPKDADALAVWDARARTLIDRIDAALEGRATTAADHSTADPLDALARRVVDRTAPPAGEIIRPPMLHLVVDRTPPPTGPRPTNMEHQPDRIDHWDAYVCRFDGDRTTDPDPDREHQPDIHPDHQPT